MFLNDYIRKFGKYSFKERHFSDVDALVFAEISYLNLDRVLNQNKDGSILLKDICLENLHDLSKRQSDTKKNKIMLPLLMKSKRYENLIIRDVVSLEDDHDVCQFYAMTIFFEDKMYISFRGTDLTLRGWKEDINMCYHNIIPGHKEASRYIHKILNKYPNHFYIGGHSKGGNLAVYAGLKVKEEDQNRLIHVYTFDGPGFYDKKIIDELQKSPVDKKIIKYVPRQSVVGIVLKHTKRAKVVEAQNVGVFQHDPFNWRINHQTGKFRVVKRRSIISYINEKALNNWLDSLSVHDIDLISDLVFESFDNLGIDLLEIKNNWWESFKKIQTSYKKLSPEDKTRLKEIGVMLIKSNNQGTRDTIKQKARQARDNIIKIMDDHK